MRTINIIITALVFMSLNAVIAQDNTTKETIKTTVLKGLTKVAPDELSTQKVSFDGKDFPVYNNKGEQLDQNGIMKNLMSGNYYPDFYINEKEEIKAAVLRIATTEEKEEMSGIKNQMNKKSDLIGQDAISFSGTDMNGKSYTLEDLKGKIIVMNFWFIACKPCIKEMPELNELLKKYNREDVVFLAFGMDDYEKTSAFLKRKTFLYTIIPNSKTVASAYNVTGFPSHIIIDQKSKITFSTVGLSPTTVSSIDTSIQKLLQAK